MALIKCPHCERPIQAEDEVCVHCGYILPKTPLSTWEIRQEMNESGEQATNVPRSAEDMERSFLHHWDVLSFFLFPIGWVMTVRWAYQHDKRWKNTLWSACLGCAFVSALITFILGYFIRW